MRQHCDQRLPRDRRRSRSGLGRTVPDRGLCARNGRVAEGRAVEVQERACLVDLRPVIGESAWVRETLCPETELAHGRRERVVPPTELRLGKAEVAAQTGGPCAERARGAGALLITAAYRAPSKARFLKAVSRGARARRRIAARGPPLREPCGNAFSAAVARASCSRCDGAPACIGRATAGPAGHSRPARAQAVAVDEEEDEEAEEQAGEESQGTGPAGVPNSLPAAPCALGGGPGGGFTRASSATERWASAERNLGPGQVSGVPTACTALTAKTSQEVKKRASARLPQRPRAAPTGSPRRSARRASSLRSEGESAPGACRPAPAPHGERKR